MYTTDSADRSATDSRQQTADMDYRSIPREATFPANLAPALPRFDNFSFSLSDPDPEPNPEPGTPDAFDEEVSLLADRIVGNELSVSFGPFPPELEFPEEVVKEEVAAAAGAGAGVGILANPGFLETR